MRYFLFGRLESIEVFSFIVKHCPHMANWVAEIDSKSFVATIEDDVIVVCATRDISKQELEAIELEDFNSLMILLYKEFMS